jgi:hypothetical protein
LCGTILLRGFVYLTLLEVAANEENPRNVGKIVRPVLQEG